MSGELSKIQQQSLAGQIIAKLDAQDSKQGDNKIDVSVWNKFFGEKSGREGTISKAEKDADLQENGTIDFKEAFDFIMKRIFKAANKSIGNEAWKDEGKREEAVDKVAREWLKAAEKTEEKDGTEESAGGDGKAGAKDEAPKKQLSADTKWSLSQLNPKDREALNSTKAGQIVLNLDAQDGADGFISQATWDEFREQAGIKDSSKSIQSRITLKNALRSINAYLNAAVRKANASKEEGAEDKTADSIADEWSAKYTGDKAFKQLTVEGIENPQSVEEIDQMQEVEEESEGQHALNSANQMIEGNKQKIAAFTGLKDKIETAIAKAKAATSKEDAEAALDGLEEDIAAQEAQKKEMHTLIIQLEALKNIAEKSDEDLEDALEGIGLQIEDLKNAFEYIEDNIETVRADLATARADAAKKPEQKQLDEDAVKAKIDAAKQDLAKKGAKLKSARVINGKEQPYYKYSDDKGVNHRVIIDPQTGDVEELVVLSDGALKKKEMITKSLYDAELAKFGITEVPKGVHAYVGFDDKKQPKLIFETKSGERIKPGRLKFMSEKIDDNFRAKIKDINTGVKDVKYTISDGGKIKITHSGNFDRITSDLMAHLTPSAPDNGDYHMGSFKSKKLSDVQNQYENNAFLLAQQTAVYQDLANKPVDQLTAQEKQFMAKVEKELFKFYNE